VRRSSSRRPSPRWVLTSWSTNASSGAGQYLEFKVYRPVSTYTYTVVGHDGPQPLTPGVLNTFPIDIPVQAGDVLGLNDHDAHRPRRLLVLHQVAG
jgi:hypothetical protein